MPPVSRERLSSFCPRRGIAYLSCASSTCSLPSRLSARWAKMSRMSCVRSMTLRSVCFAIALACAGESSRSKTSTSASSSIARTTTSSSLPFPITSFGSMWSRIWMTASAISTPAVRASSRSSRMLSSASRSGLRTSGLVADVHQDGAPSFALTTRARARRANSASRSPISLPTSTCDCGERHRADLAVGRGAAVRAGDVVGPARARAARRPARAGSPPRDRDGGERGRPDRRASGARLAGACARGAARESALRPRAVAPRPGASASRRRPR